MSTHDEGQIVITGLTAISSVGLNLEQTCASIRAGISRFSEHPYYACLTEDPEWDEEEPLIASAVSGIDPFLDGPERLYELTIPALRDLMRGAGIMRRDLASGGFFMALPQLDRVVEGWRLQEEFLPELFHRTGIEGFKMTKIDQSGHAGGYVLMREAVALLVSSQISFCIVGGVDSYLTEERLKFMDESRRIKSSRNVDGFVPGEAASMVLLETATHAKQRGVSIRATILKVSLGEEAVTIRSDKSSSGAGLASALRELHPSGSEDKMRWMLCDLNGESYRSGEWGIVRVRLADRLGELKTLQHPADCLGDVGAATGGMLLAYASHAFHRGYSIAETVTAWTSSDDGLRGAIRIGQPELRQGSAV